MGRLGTLYRPAFKLNLTEALCAGVLRLQRLSYHMRVVCGFASDFPRNLSKTLTVDRNFFEIALCLALYQEILYRKFLKIYSLYKINSKCGSRE